MRLFTAVLMSKPEQTFREGTPRALENGPHHLREQAH
jgi:hypothetical protein